MLLIGIVRFHALTGSSMMLKELICRLEWYDACYAAGPRHCTDTDDIAS